MNTKKKKAAFLFIFTVLFHLLTCSGCPAMPAVMRTQLPNQLKLLVFQDHSSPAVTLELLVAAGSSEDPPGMEGLANLTAKSLFLGTSHFSFDQINGELDFIGGSYGAECSRDFATVGMQVLKKDLDVGAGLFADIIEHSTFPAAEVGFEKDQVLVGLQEQEDDPLEIANKAFDRGLFREGPCGASVEGGGKSVRAIDPRQLPIFYNSFYRPNNAVLVIGGDITPEEVRTKIAPLFLGWKAGPLKPRSVPNPSAQREVKVVIDRPVSQAAIVVGGAAMKRESADYYPFLVLKRVLAATGLALRLDACKDSGSFRVAVRTRNSSARRTTAKVLQALEDLRGKPVSDSQLKAAKEFLTGDFPLRYSLSGEFARFLAESEFRGLGADYPEKYPALIEAVTASDIQRVAGEYLAPPHVVVVVGDLKRMNEKANPPRSRRDRGEGPAT